MHGKKICYARIIPDSTHKGAPMTFHPGLASRINETRTRSRGLSPQSGMCSLCTAECPGMCEIGLSAVLGAQSVYPTTTGDNQIASEKDYPLDYSHFNINGRVFGAQGAPAHADTAAIFNVKLESTLGRRNPVKIALPLLLPALLKMNWQDYFAGAAMAGVCCVIGEGSPSKDPALLMRGGKITAFPYLPTILDAFRRYYRGFGQIVLQTNFEEDAQGLAEYAIRNCGAEAVEFKFGQSAKGTQPVTRLKGLEDALKKKQAGALVHPDPEDPAIQAAAQRDEAPNFYAYGRLPMWDEAGLARRIAQLRDMGLKNVYFKMAGFDPADIEKVLRIACAADVDVVTFDGAGGGSGYSPCKMMNEWGLPTVCLESRVQSIARKLDRQGMTLPSIVITGGFATEDQVFKALALGAPYIQAVGLCRAAMAAANSAKKVGELIDAGNIPAHLQKYGSTKETIFGDLPDLKHIYGKEAESFPPGAIGVFSYLNRIAVGLRHFAALNRKFDVALLAADDVIPLTREASELLANA